MTTLRRSLTARAVGLGAVGLVATLLLAPSAGARSADTPASGTTAAADKAASSAEPTRSFGALLPWSSPGDALRYATAIGGTPGFYGETLGYPLRSADVQELERITRASAAQGAEVLVQFAPRQALSTLTGAQASALAGTLQTLHQRYSTRFLVDFAPEMNGSWQRWGQQPEAFKAAYRTVARAVHRDVASASMVWEPANGAGYPFRSSRGEVRPSGPRVTSQLDTNGDGKVTETDDPYKPYWPGSASVDVVGFADYWYGSATTFGRNSLPPAGTFAASLHGTTGYSTASGAGRDFVQRYSTSKHKPLLVETGALYVPGEKSGPTQTAIADDWLDQVFSSSIRSQFPTLRSVLWFEQSHRSPEAGNRIVDWRLAGNTAVVRHLRSLLEAGNYPLGPVPKAAGRTQANAVLAQADQPTGESDDVGTVRVLGGIAALLGIFLFCGIARRWLPSWRYPMSRDPGFARQSPIRRIGADGRRLHQSQGDGRDGRIDLLRGFVMCLVIITHLQLGGPYSWFSDRFGALTGAEMFVLLSGIVLGALYPRLVTRMGVWSATTTMFRRAGRLWVETAVVILTVFFVAKIPFIDGRSVTTFTDQGTGLGGEAAAGRVYYLYGTAQHLLDYPPPFFALRDLVLLRYGPWPMNIMGLFVVLSAAVPAAMWLVRRGLWWVLLGLSWGLYALNVVHPVTVFDAEFEAVFPLLTWQVAFTHGLVIGRYRVKITQALSSRVGIGLITVVLGAYVALLALLESGAHFGSLTRANLYNDWYQRVNLEGGRLVDLALCLIVFYAILTSAWKPLHATVGRVFEPIGRWSLQVFYLQVFFVLFAYNIPHLSTHSSWQGTVIGTVSMGLAWAWSAWRDHRTAPPKPVVKAPEPKKQELALAGR